MCTKGADTAIWDRQTPTHLYHCSIAPVMAIPPGTWNDIRPNTFILSPVSAWKAESVKCLACQSSSIDTPAGSFPFLKQINGSLMWIWTGTRASLFLLLLILQYWPDCQWLLENHVYSCNMNPFTTRSLLGSTLIAPGILIRLHSDLNTKSEFIHNVCSVDFK